MLIDHCVIPFGSINWWTLPNAAVTSFTWHVFGPAPVGRRTSLSPEKSFTTPLMVQVLVDNPAELEKIRERESDITKERIQKVLDAGANVVLTTKGIDDMSLKYFVEAGVIACRRVPKEDLR